MARLRHLVSVVLAAALAAEVQAQRDLAEVQPLLDQASAAVDRGETARAIECLGKALDAVDAFDPEGTNGDAWLARYRCGQVAWGLDLKLSARAWEGVLRGYAQQGTRVLEDPAQLEGLQSVRGFLADVRAQQRNDPNEPTALDEAVRLRRTIVEDWQRAGATLPAALARAALGQTLVQGNADQGLTGLKELEAAYQVVRAERPDSAELADVARRYANSLVDMAQHFDPRVLDLQSTALEYWRRHPPASFEDKKGLMELEWESANVRAFDRQLPEARALAQASLAAAEALFDKDRPDTFSPRGVLAAIMRDMGDLAAAEELTRQNTVCVQSLPARHLWRMQAWDNYGLTLSLLGKHDEAIAAYEKALAAIDPTENTPFARNQVAALYDNAGVSYSRAGRHEDAIRMLEAALKEDAFNYALGRAQKGGAMGMVLQRRGKPGDLRKAAEWFARSVPDVVALQGGYRQPVLYLRRQALTLSALKDKGLQACLEQLLEVGERALEECYTLPGRPGLELAAVAEQAAQQVLALAAEVPAAKKKDLEQRAFELLESLRGIGERVTNLAKRLPSVPGAEQQLVAARAARSQLAKLASLGEGAKEDIVEEARKRDASAFAELMAKLEGGRLPVAKVTVDGIAAALPEGAAAVAFRTVTMTRPDEDRPGDEVEEQVFEAHVVTRKGGKGRFERVTLGDPEPMRTAAKQWLERILEKSTRGGTVSDPKKSDPEAALDRFLFGTLKPKLSGAKVLVVCLDDELHKVPVELLPGAKDLELRFAVSLVDLIAPSDAPLRKESLFVVGGVDFDELPGGTAAEEPGVTAGAATDTRAAAPLWGEEARVSKYFLVLSETGPEATNLARQFESRFKVPAALRTGREVTHAACEREAQQARFLHFATHGYFLTADPDDASARDDAVRGFAPMSLCGLALTGANRTGDDDYVGVITGEEIAALDLTGCELAVLSACETYLGVPRPGHGLASLQSALHAAGVRIAITSRWTIPDSASAQLMQQFYARFWRGMPARRALAEAKAEVKQKNSGALSEPYFWAAFILTGSPRD